MKLYLIFFLILAQSIGFTEHGFSEETDKLSAAVKKGNIALAEAVKQDMDIISTDERASIERKWLARSSVKTENTLIISMSKSFQPFTFINSEGKPAGLFVDMWKLWSKKTGRRIEFLPSAWSEAIENIKNKNADIHSGLAVTPEREQSLIFSQPLYENTFCLFFPLKQGKPLSLRELSGQKAGVVQNSSQEEYLRKNYPDIELVLFRSTEETILNAKNGNVRAFADSYHNTSAAIVRLGLSGEFETGKEILYTKTFHPTVLRDNTELASLVDKGFDAISNKELAEIEKHWIPEQENRYFKPDMKKIRLTAAEQAWIKEHPKIRVESFDGYPPVGFMSQEGLFNGINADYLTLISERTGIEIEYVFTERGMADSMIKDRKLDIIYSYNVPKRREYLNFTRPFYYTSYMIISRADSPFISNLNALKGHKVAVAKGMRVLDRLRNDYPAIEIYSADTPLKGLQDVSLNNADVFIGSQNSTVYLMQKHRLNNLKISGINLYENEPYMFAIRNDWPELCGIFNKAIDSISKEEHDAISQKWFPVRFEHKVNWAELWYWAFGIGSFFIFILGISLLWNRRLAKEIRIREKTEESLRKSEELFRAIFDNAAFSMCLVNLQGQYIQVNQAFASLLNYSIDELLQTTNQQITYKEDIEKTRAYMSALLKGEINHHRVEKRFVRKDGQTVWGDLAIGVLYNKKGEIESFIGIVADITDRKRVEEELINAKVAAESATRTKSEFLANMSHEIRTPMNSVLGFIQLSLDSSELPESQRINLKTAYNSAQSLLTLINDILDLNKLESGKIEIEQYPFDLVQMIQDTLTTFEIRCKQKGLNLSSMIHPDVSRYYIGDSLRLKQILINLIGNAVKFTDRGEVRVEIKNMDRGGKMNATSSIILFSVSDTGIGIPADGLNKIFEPFSQVDSSISRRYGGTGLGTTISKQLTELMGGKIWVESEEGKGSIFHFTVNLETMEKNAELIMLNPELTPHSAFSFRHSALRILLADDIEENTMLARIRLTQQGHTVIEARNGYEAVSAYEHEKPDIILMDIHMPKMDGIEAVRRIREIETVTGNHIPIIALTASVMSKEKERYFQIGIDDVVAKPIHFGELFKAMEKLIPSGISVEMAEIEQTEKKFLKYDGYKTISGIDMQEGLDAWQNLDAYIKALHGFSDDYAEIAYTISQQLNEQDAKNIRATLHKLKGISGNLKLKEVYKITVKIDALIGENRIYDAKGYLPHLTIALSEVIESIKNLETDHDHETPLKNKIDIHNISKLFDEMMKGFNQFNPYILQPIISELESYLLKDQLKPIVRDIEKFEFNQAKVELINLSKKIGIILKENGE